MRNSGMNINVRRQFLKHAAAIAASLAAPLSIFAAAPSKIKIGIVGSGRVGTAIGTAWLKAGHEVMFSSTNLEKNKQLAATLGPNAKAGTPREAAAFGEVLVISVPYTALPSVGKELADLIKGKIIIDTSNPIERRDGEMGLAAREKGAGLASAEYLPGAHIVRAFNAIGAARMAVANQDAGKIGMPIAGEDAKAIEVASALIRDVGYEPVLVGDYAMGKYLIPGTPLAGEHSPEEIRKIVASLK
jgi:8-hydroxy-5-deazaflavin:NADPH oxidoreductase